MTDITDVKRDTWHGIRMNDKREHERIGVPPLAVTIDGQRYRADEWSFGGFLIDADPTDLPPGALVSIEGVGPDNKKLTNVGIRARVVRASDDGTHVALTCLHLDDDAFRVLAELGG